MYIDTPRVITETAQGFTSCRIVDQMLERREIVLNDEINAQRMNSILIQLLHLEREDSEKGITLYLDSPGGTVDSALCVIDTMKAIGCPVTVINTGMCASMAAVLFIAADTRMMLPNSRLMFHDPRIPNASGSALHLRDVADGLMSMRDTIAEIIKAHSKLNLEEVFDLTAKDSFLSADRALELGMTDAILTKITSKDADGK